MNRIFKISRPIKSVFVNKPIFPITNFNTKPTEKKTESKINTLLIKDESINLSVLDLFKIYKRLSKAKLGGLVVLSTMCGYAMAPLETSLMPLLCTTLGTWLCINSANGLNQLFEQPYDAQMTRTRTRPIVTGQISPFHACNFSIINGALGTLILFLQVNPLTAFLGLSNIILYSFVYTPAKRLHIINTWIGAIVGAIPPLMGWVACTGTINFEGLLLASILYFWQFPHFNSLSWMLKEEYCKAGYRMMAVTNPNLNGRVSLRHSIMLLLVTPIFPLVDLTTFEFIYSSLPINLFLFWKSVIFWYKPNEKSSKSLFFVTLFHLPIIFALLMYHKKEQKYHTQPANN